MSGSERSGPSATRKVRAARAATSPVRAAVALAAVATVCVAVGMDVVAGEHPSHSLTIGVIAAVVAAMRLRLAGNYSGYFSALSGALVAQPALHAATKLLPPPALAGHAAETSVSVGHVLLAALVVAAVTGAQGLILLVAAAEWVVAGLAAGFGFSYMIGLAVSLRVLRRATGALALRALGAAYARWIVAAVPAAAAASLIAQLVLEQWGSGAPNAAVALVCALIVFTAGYGAIISLMTTE